MPMPYRARDLGSCLDIGNLVAIQCWRNFVMIEKFCRDRGPKMGNSPPWSSAPSNSLLLSFLKHPKFNINSLFITKTRRNLKKNLPKCIYYTNEFNYNYLFLIQYKNWVFYLDFTKYKTKPNSAFFFTTKVLDADRFELCMHFSKILMCSYNLIS